MAPCSLCRRGFLHLMAAITREAVMPRMLRHGTLASGPPPMAPARLRQKSFVFDDAHAGVSR
jgi:hypothetical protein